ncbi:transcription factor IIF subunit tfg1 [Entomophthora muscae]|uniref:Transcription factor IIF subunit tfg1 n=1 Tax=Entomophthora muscae TaxID=34485 RepID=A0ACC2UPH7_9FUNG|nr:transcription factor IIF subunit tfg1 [Entomophthora muscae]
MRSSQTFLSTSPSPCRPILKDLERPRQYHERLKELPKLKYCTPRLHKSKASDEKLTFRSCNLYGTSKDPPNVERHLMLGRRKIKPLKSMLGPLTMVRKPISNPVEQEVAAHGHLTKAELKQIAPDGGAVSNKRHTFQKRTRQVFEHDKVAREERRREANPWVLENGEGKEELRGVVEQGSRARYVALTMRKNGGFDVRLINRLYNFDPPPKYHVPNAAESEALLNAKKIDMDKWFSKMNATSEASGPKVKAVERGDELRSKDKKKDADDADELDYDEDFQDDEEMGLDDEYEETKEVGERNRKRQSRLNPASSSSNSSNDDSDQEAISKDDHTVKRLKKMVGVDDGSSSDEDEAPKTVIRKLEIPVSGKALAKKETQKVAKSLPKKEAPIAAPAQSNSLPGRSDNLDPKLLTPHDIAMIIKNHPNITMRDLALKLKLNLVKWSSEQKTKFMEMLYTVVYKPKDSPILQLHKAYQ